MRPLRRCIRAPRPPEASPASSRRATRSCWPSWSEDAGKRVTRAPAVASTGPCCPPPDARQRTSCPATSPNHSGGTGLFGVRTSDQSPTTSALNFLARHGACPAVHLAGQSIPANLIEPVRVDRAASKPRIEHPFPSGAPGKLVSKRELKSAMGRACRGHARTRRCGITPPSALPAVLFIQSGRLRAFRSGANDCRAAG